MAVNRTKVLEAAQKFLTKGQYDKAVSEYQKLIQEDPRDVRTLLKIGDLHTRRNKPKDAIDVYERVADLYAKQGFFLKAVAVYKQILKLDAAHLGATEKLARMYEELALTSDALTTYELVADAYVAQGQMHKALDTLARMVELDQANVAVRIKQAEALSKAERPREAAQAFAAGAQLLREQGRMDDYVRVVERQLYHDPDNLAVARELSRLYLERNDPKRALSKLQVCFKADPRDVQTLEMLAEAFRQLGQQPKTISVLKEIARLHGDAGSEEPRRRTLRRVLDLDPQDAEALQALQAPGRPTAVEPKSRAAEITNVSSTAARPTAAPPPRRAEAQPVSEELDLEAAEELEVIDDEPSDDVLIVDEPAGPSSLAPEDAEALAADRRVISLLGEADAREGAGDYEGAVAALQGVIELEPTHAEAHERLKDIYIAADRRVEAVKELLWLSNSWEPLNHDRAASYARSAYELAPHSEATRRRLAALGVTLGGEHGPDDLADSGPDLAAMDAELDEILPVLSSLPPSEFVSEEPGPLDLLALPIDPAEFDLPAPRTNHGRALKWELLEREVSPEEFDRIPTRGTLAPAPHDVERDDEDDEPLLASVPRKSVPGLPVLTPRTALSEPSESSDGDGDESERLLAMYRRAPAPPFAQAPDTQRQDPPAELLRSELPQVASTGLPGSTDTARGASDSTMPESGARSVTPSQAPSVDVQEVLDEAAFFASQGLLDEALEVIQESILIYPSSAILKVRLAEYEAQADQSDEQAERAGESSEDESFDIAEQLASELAEVSGPAESDESVDVESVFAQFKKGVAEQIAPEDSDTHFDLGIAYKEMGLFADAVNEFELAARSKKRACTALTMVGMCHLERGDRPLALSYLQRALSSEPRTAAEELALHYEIGCLHEQMGSLDKALASFEKVAAKDRTYRGVAGRLEPLKKRGGGKSAKRRR